MPDKKQPTMAEKLAAMKSEPVNNTDSIADLAALLPELVELDEPVQQLSPQELITAGSHLRKGDKLLFGGSVYRVTIPPCDSPTGSCTLESGPALQTFITIFPDRNYHRYLPEVHGQVAKRQQVVKGTHSSGDGKNG